MICVSIADMDFKGCLKLLEKLDFAEIRLDRMRFSDEELKCIFSMPLKIIATCRHGRNTEQICAQLLEKAVESGAAFVDIEASMNHFLKKRVVEKARQKKAKVIVSFHDYKKTPSRKKLLQIIKKCFKSGADIAKIACKVNFAKDNARLIGLLDSEKKLIVVGMGKKGKITRLTAPFFGSNFSFAAVSKGKETAVGQIEVKKMEKIFEVLKNA